MAIVDRSSAGNIEEEDLWIPPGQRENLARLNPGREQEIEQFLTRVSECENRLMAEAMPRLARSAARGLGEERLARLVAFLDGPGGAAIERRSSEGTPLPDELVEAWRPLRRDYGAFMYSIPTYVDADLMASMTRCHADEAARLGLRIDEPTPAQ